MMAAIRVTPPNHQRRSNRESSRLSWESNKRLMSPRNSAERNPTILSTIIEATTSLESRPIRDVLKARMASAPTVAGRNIPPYHGSTVNLHAVKKWKMHTSPANKPGPFEGHECAICCIDE
jgi:hypothetical protein